MFIETIKVEGLSNHSYVVGSEQTGRSSLLTRSGTSTTTLP